MGSGILKTCRKLFAYTLLGGGTFTFAALLLTSPVQAAAGINQQVNFQGRLLNSQGAVVPDGYYNIEFKIYENGDGLSANDATPAGSPGTLLWTEDYYNYSPSSLQGVEVTNGFLSVQLGSTCSFTGGSCQGHTNSAINWNQDTLWLSMAVGNTSDCTQQNPTDFQTQCGADSEMLPMKRLSSSVYALDSLNSDLLGGYSSGQYVQLGIAMQTDNSSNASIAINKTGTGSLVDLQSNGIDAFTINATGDATFGANANHTLSVATAGASTAGQSLSVIGGAAGTGGSALAGGDLSLTAGAGGGTNGNGGNLNLNAGTANGTGAAGTITIGTVASQITIGGASTGSTNVTVGTGSSASSGSTTVQAKGNVTIATNGTTRATYDTNNHLYFGNGITSSSPSGFTLSTTGSNVTGVAGGALTIQAGSGTVGNANGGNLNLDGGAGIGTGTNGLVVLQTPTFEATINDPNCYPGGSLAAANCTVAQATVDDSSTVIIGFSASGQTAYLPNPTNTTPGRVFYITAANGSQDFTLSVNGGGTGNEVAMRQDSSATMVWNGTAWGAAGASSSTDLQAAYDNTLQSAGGAELIVSHTSNTDGLTIRDSLTNPTSGPLVSIQNNSAATLFSVNNNIVEYSEDGGAEIAGNTSGTFPANSWSAVGAASVSRYTTVGSYIATGQGSVSVGSTTANDGVKDTLSTTLDANQHYNVSFAARLGSGNVTFSTMNVYYSVDGTTQSVSCITGQIVPTSEWTKVNCAFAAPASGITASNAILIEQSDPTVRTFYIDNLSVTISADYSYDTDGGVDNGTNFTTNWPAVNGATVTRSTTTGEAASDSAEVQTSGANQGVSNLLSINPLQNTLYRVTVYVATSATNFNDFTVEYTPNNGTNTIGCVDYNTQTIANSTTTFTEVTCNIETDGTAVTTPYVYFMQGSSDATASTYYVDSFSYTLETDTTPNVQVGGGVNGGPVTLLTLDRAASAPIASNNDAFLGSMYYDTTLNEIQCYEAGGWGSCGASPNTVVTISPEYTNAVMHGTGVGTMTSDICSSTLHINDGTSGQATICGSNETYNFYKWTSPQASAQTYSIYVTYQLPDTFKTFASGQSSLMGRTDSTNSTVQYSIYKNDASTGLTQCGPIVPVSTGSVSSWQTGAATGAADPSTCGFSPGDSIVFKIDVVASQDADAYVGNLNFTFSHK